MFDSKSIDDIANRLANAIPPSFNHLKEDMEKNFHAILQSALARLDLVSRVYNRQGGFLRIPTEKRFLE